MKKFLLILLLLSNSVSAEKINLTCNLKLTDDLCHPQIDCKTTNHGDKKGYVEVNIFGKELFISFEEGGMFWTYLSHWKPNDRAQTIEYNTDDDLFYVKQKWITDDDVNIEESISLSRVSGTIQVEKKSFIGNSYLMTKYYGVCEKTSGKRKF